MAKTFEEFWATSGMTKFEETARAGWEARQEEINDLKAQLYPYLKEEFLTKRMRFIINNLYPTRGQKREFHHPEMTWWHGGIDNVEPELAFQGGNSGIVGIEWSMWTTDHTESHTTIVPREWVDFDNQVSNEDLVPIMKQWCEDLAQKMAIEKDEKENQAKLDKIKRLENELARAKGELK